MQFHINLHIQPTMDVARQADAARTARPVPVVERSRSPCLMTLLTIESWLPAATRKRKRLAPYNTLPPYKTPLKLCLRVAMRHRQDLAISLRQLRWRHFRRRAEIL